MDNELYIDLEEGKKYLITHSHKGTCTVEVETLIGDVAFCVVVDGKLEATSEYIEKGPGDKIIIHRSFITSAKEIK